MQSFIIAKESRAIVPLQQDEDCVIGGSTEGCQEKHPEFAENRNGQDGNKAEDDIARMAKFRFTASLCHLHGRMPLQGKILRIIGRHGQLPAFELQAAIERRLEAFLPKPGGFGLECPERDAMKDGTDRQPHGEMVEDCAEGNGKTQADGTVLRPAMQHPETDHKQTAGKRD